MELVRIIDLVGKDIKGRKADIRTRVNGEVFYNFPDQKDPIIVTMKEVRWKYQKISKRDEKLSKWLYWSWEGYSCGYSGTANPEDWEKDQIMLL